VLELRIPREVGAQYLDRDVAVEPHVASEVHLGHAPVAERLAQLVAVRQ
jgi:hypothetical protein